MVKASDCYYSQFQCFRARYVTEVDRSAVGTQRSGHHLLHETNLWRFNVHAQKQYHTSWSQGMFGPFHSQRLRLRLFPLMYSGGKCELLHRRQLYSFVSNVSLWIGLYRYKYITSHPVLMKSMPWFLLRRRSGKQIHNTLYSLQQSFNFLSLLF